MRLEGEQYLWYKAFKIDVALIRGTTADTEGNVTFEKEAFYGDALNMVSCVLLNFFLPPFPSSTRQPELHMQVHL